MSKKEQPAAAGQVEQPVRRVVCAALRAADGTLLLGVRHYSADMHAQLERRDDRKRFCDLSGDNQGFVDQHGVYMTRREAYDVAMLAGQIVNHSACERGRLYSEGLY